MINMENKCHAKFLDEMDSMNMMKRTPSMPMKQDCIPSSIYAAQPSG
jgi:hypothetical protein